MGNDNRDFPWWLPLLLFPLLLVQVLNEWVRKKFGKKIDDDKKPENP